MLTRRSIRFLAPACLVWGLLFIPAASHAAQDAPALTPPGTTTDDIASLVRQLGDADFRVREEATRRLRAVGKPAMPALREALGSDDPEVCSRADSLLRQIEKPRIPQGWFRNFNGWRRRDVLRTGTRIIEVLEGDRRAQVVEGPAGIEITVSGVDDGQSVYVSLRARDADDLRRQDADAYAVYERLVGARPNVNIRGRRLLVPGAPVPLPEPVPMPVPGRRPAARLLPLAPEGGLLRPPADDLAALEDRIRQQMEGAGVAAAERQAVMEALRMLRDIQARGQLLPPEDLEAQVRKYNDLSDALRKKLEELKLPGPGDALPPPARARLGVSVSPDSLPPEANGVGGVTVTMVIPGSRGEKLGLRAGDQIRRVNDNRVDDATTLRRVLTETKEPLVVVVKRPGEAAVITLREKAE